MEPKLSEATQNLLDSLAATVDMNLYRLSQAEKAVKVSTDLLLTSFELVLRDQGLDPTDYRLTRAESRVQIEPKEA